MPNCLTLGRGGKEWAAIAVSRQAGAAGRQHVTAWEARAKLQACTSLTSGGSSPEKLDKGKQCQESQRAQILLSPIAMESVGYRIMQLQSGDGPSLQLLRIQYN